VRSAELRHSDAPAAGAPVSITCEDGVALGGRIWPAAGERRGLVVINAATGVRASYYHRYARFLNDHGFEAITYDYRGVGASRPASLRGLRWRWSDWGRYDFEAVLRLAISRAGQAPLLVVGHSIGGFLPGLAPSAPAISRMLTVGAQHAWWRDYAPDRRLQLFLKWHVAMPALTALFGYFPGQLLGWLEDLPAGVANEWSFRRERMEKSHPKSARADILARFKAVKAPILALALSDDDLAPPAAVLRGLSYYSGARRSLVTLSPADLGQERLGHVGLFHSRCEEGAWRPSLEWLVSERQPWPTRQTTRLEPQP